MYRMDTLVKRPPTTVQGCGEVADYVGVTSPPYIFFWTNGV